MTALDRSLAAPWALLDSPMTASIARPVEPAVCPLCGAANQCAMEIEKTTGITQPPCWCTAVTFDAQLIDQVEPASRARACICQVCVSRFQTP